MALPVGVRAFFRDRKIYLLHVIGLFAPGWAPPVHDSVPITPNRKLPNWNNPDYALMIEEGRRQIDKQRSDLLEVRSRSQLLFTAGLGVGALFGGQLQAVRYSPDDALTILWTLGALCLSWAVMGAAAVMVVQGTFKSIDTGVLSNQSPPIDKYLASAYAGMLVEGSRTINTRITLFREAVLWLIASFALLTALVVVK